MISTPHSSVDVAPAGPTGITNGDGSSNGANAPISPKNEYNIPKAPKENNLANAPKEHLEANGSKAPTARKEPQEVNGSKVAKPAKVKASKPPEAMEKT